MSVYVGTSGFSYPKWKGTFYPAKMPAKDMLGFYAGRFRSVEINNTFYGPPDPAVLAGWAAQVPAHFRFAFKAPQEVTHFKRLKDVADPLARFLDSAGAISPQLGPLLFQLPPNFKKDVPRLRDLLALLPSGCRTTLEFRHASWFDDEVFGVLHDHHAALCVAEETDDLAVPFVATADWGYLRLRRLDYDDKALAAWAKRLKTQSWTDCFVFFKHEDTGTGPDFAARLLKLLEQETPSAAEVKRAG
jgi:uncharacterized protein YecE (DUF72 family)